MKIGRQWSQRLELWSENLKKHFYQPLGTMVFEGFETEKHMSVEAASRQRRTLMPPGTSWGRMWQYGWFFTDIELNDKHEDQRIMLHIGTGIEMLVWINGKVIGSIDHKHPLIEVPAEAVRNRRVQITAEVYAGHGPRLEHGGPCPVDQEPFDYPKGHQVTVETSTYGLWREGVYQTWLDYEALYQTFNQLSEHSLRRMNILEGLKQFTYKADFELPGEQMIDSILEARKILQPLLACVNGSTAPRMSVIGQSHLDLAWLWTFEETKRKSARTYSNQLALMEQYKEYRFLLCEPPILESLKNYYPEVYDRVKEKVKEGRMVPEGSMWVESDCNLTGGESLVRQFLYGKKWFREELSTETRMAWMPDTFGFTGALPQILAGCEVPYFATQKLLRADPEMQPFPYNIFWWEGIDGTRVLAHMFKKNNARLEPEGLIERWESDRNQTEGIDGLVYPFGFGDGGGGATRDMLEMYDRCQDLEGVPRCVMESPVEYFERVSSRMIKPVHVGELYLSWHRGTYTTQSEMKKGVRKGEYALRELEFWTAMMLMERGDIPDGMGEKLEVLWKKLLFNTFHDILPGTSIKEVHEEARTQLEEVIAQSRQCLNELMDFRGNGEKEAAVLYNSFGYERQFLGHKVPPYSSVLRPESPTEQWQSAFLGISQSKQGYTLENSCLKVEVDSVGQITGLVTKENAKEWLAGPGNQFLMYKDVPGYYDAWELEKMMTETPLILSNEAVIEPLEEEDAVGVLVRRQLNRSELTQKIMLRKESKQLEFHTVIDWQERHKFLKVAFPTAVYSREAVCDIQFGYMKRPTHQSGVFEQDRYEVWHHKYAALSEGDAGIGLLNDCKYGLGLEDSTMTLSLLKAPVYPDKTADIGIHEFKYALCPFLDGLQSVIEASYDFNHPLVEGRGQLTESLFSGLPTNIHMSTAKLAEDGSNTVILRLFEGLGVSTTATLNLPACVLTVEEATMLERPKLSLKKPVRLSFRPFEIKTLRLSLEARDK